VRSEVWRPAAGIALGLALLAGGVVLAVRLSARLPDGPQPVDWDGVACARCGMLVSDPAFAGQLQLRDGSVRYYDDPGCLLLDLAEPGLPPFHAAWLHHQREDRWLPLERSAFARVDHSPMGYGLATVDAEAAPDALAVAEAQRRLTGELRSSRAEP
jgi:hypothetical protein